MSLEKLVSTIKPKDYNILGLNLRPFCLGHYFLMKDYGCRMISEVGGEAEYGDLLLGCLICSRTYEEFLEFEKLEDNSWLDRTTVWQWLCRRSPSFTYHPKSLRQWTEKWGNEVRKSAKRGDVNIITEFKRFRLYMNEGIDEPDYDIESDGGGDRAESGTHWTEDLLYILMTKFPYSESEAKNLAMCRAFAAKYKWLEAEGEITINSEDDSALYEQQKANGVNLNFIGLEQNA